MCEAYPEGNGNQPWHDTGDLGYIKDGDLFIVGRQHDSLVIDGVNVHAVDIEQDLSERLQIDECIAHQKENQLTVLLVARHTDQRRLATARGILHSDWGIINANVREIHPKHVLRSSSGKIQKGKTLEYNEVCDNHHE